MFAPESITSSFDLSDLDSKAPCGNCGSEAVQIEPTEFELSFSIESPSDLTQEVRILAKDIPVIRCIGGNDYYCGMKGIPNLVTLDLKLQAAQRLESLGRQDLATTVLDGMRTDLPSMRTHLFTGMQSGAIHKSPVVEAFIRQAA